MNSSPRQQQTIATVARITGTGYWTGQPVTVEFRPASVGSAIVFVRSDLMPTRRIAATSANCVETPRRTTLAANGASVEMVEHILAALHGLRIDNCEVWVNAAEMPACDGSSLEATQALIAAGIVQQAALVHQLIVQEPTRVGDAREWIEALPVSRPGLSISYDLAYGPDTSIRDQMLETAITPEIFRTELAPARTFVLEAEARQMQLDGLGSNVTYNDILVFGADGPLDNTLRFADECVRHKILDIVGDLALAGPEIHGHIRACRSGHRLNAALVKSLVAQASLGLRHSA